MNTEALQQIFTETQEGKLTFPQVVQRLLALNVESYLIDLAAARKTCYLADGATHTQPFFLTLDPVVPEFSAARLIDAIRAAQADTIRYPEFLRRSAAAGVVGYWAFLTGKRVVYFGRQGELHIEEFPRPNP